MDRRLKIALAAMGLGLGAVVAIRYASALPKGSKILLVGDSLAVGLTSPMKAIAQKMGYVFSGNGVVGSRTDQWEDKLPSLLASEAPQLVLVSLGTNDAAAGNVSHQFDHFQAVANAVRSFGAKLVWIAPPTLPSRIDDRAVRAYINQVSSKVIDSRAIAFERSPDGIHATPSGYQSWASAIWPALEWLGEIR